MLYKYSRMNIIYGVYIYINIYTPYNSIKNIGHIRCKKKATRGVTTENVYSEYPIASLSCMHCT